MQPGRREICENCGEYVPATDAICEYCGEFIDQDAAERDVWWANKNLSHAQIFLLYAGAWVMSIVSVILILMSMNRDSLYLLAAGLVLLLVGSLLGIYGARSWLRKKGYSAYLSALYGPLEIFFLPKRDD